MIKSYAPGRAELLGNHTDYNGGLVLSIAVERGILVSGEVRTNSEILIYARELRQTYEGSLDRLEPSTEKPWANYLLGVFDEFRKRGLALGGVDLTIQSDLPPGAGLSSSAALETATAFFLRHAFGHGASLDNLEMARIGQAAEHRYAGVKCGLLDQISSIYGKAGHATFIDCRSFEVKNIPLPDDLRFVIANSGVKHALVNGEYNERRESCEAAAHALGVHNLREVDSATLERLAGKLSPAALKRARHVVGEIERVSAGVEALIQGDAKDFGELMFTSHRSSIENFENSCPELDRLVEVARTVPGCLGARLSGGGFGGATINLVEPGREAALVEALEKALPGTTCLVTKAANGAHVEA